MKLVITDIDVLNTKYGMVGLNSMVLYNITKKKNNILVMVANMELEDIKSNLMFKSLGYDYLYFTENNAIYDKSNEFVSYAYSVDDMSKTLCDLNDLEYDSVRVLKKSRTYGDTIKSFSTINE